MKLSLHFLFTWIAAAARQQQLVQYLLEENRVLREHIKPKRLRFTDPQRRRLARAAKSVPRADLLSFATLVNPDTLLRWYRKLVAAKYDAGRSTRQGRPQAVRARVQQLVLQMANQNPGWAYTRIRDAIHHLGIEVGRNTIARILDQHGIEPAPSRSKGMAWNTFLKLHWGAIAAMDFFSVEVLTTRGLVRYFALIVIDLKTRRVHLAGLSSAPDGRWMRQVARNLTDAVDGFLLHKTKLIVDRDPLYTAAFAHTLKAAKVQLVRLPRASPNLNAYAERVIRSIKYECLRHVIPLGDDHLRHVLNQYLIHYHAERNHQGLGGALIDGAPPAVSTVGRARRTQRLHGLLNHYYRDAA